MERYIIKSIQQLPPLPWNHSLVVLLVWYEVYRIGLAHRNVSRVCADERLRSRSSGDDGGWLDMGRHPSSCQEFRKFLKNLLHPLLARDGSSNTNLLIARALPELLSGVLETTRVLGCNRGRHPQARQKT